MQRVIGRVRAELTVGSALQAWRGATDGSLPPSTGAFGRAAERSRLLWAAGAVSPCANSNPNTTPDPNPNPNLDPKPSRSIALTPTLICEAFIMAILL